MEGNMKKWQIWIDRGGTFTDIVGKNPDGELVSHKLLSENPENYEDAAIQGIRDLLGVKKDEPIPYDALEHVKMGTTVATNALLERKGDRTLYLTTKGFGDALRIGYQNRPQLFDLHIVLPELLYEQVLEVDERLDASGQILIPLDADGAREGLLQAYASGIRAVAITLLHGYKNNVHEQQLAQLAAEIGFTQISMSQTVSPLMKLVARGDTTVVDAYLSPILRRYVEQVSGRLGAETRLLFMQSNGGLTDARMFRGKDAILSGPAGGVVGMVSTSLVNGYEKVIGFDMGGTSTDVAHYCGEFERSFETVVAGVRMRAPMMHIHTVAAGGGSILHFDGSRYRVGPDSAGANPGPACYRRGGPLTVTDCNVMLGKIQPDFFPAVFGPEADQPLDAEVVRQHFTALAHRVSEASGRPLQRPEEVAEGFLRIAVLNMASAIKQISVQRGYDVTEYTMNCFGGAGGQHACLVADALGMKRVLLHPFAGVLSAYGMGLADLRAMRERQVEVPFDQDALSILDALCAPLKEEVMGELVNQGVEEDAIQVQVKVHLRYEATDTSLLVDLASVDAMREAFEAAHKQQFGFIAHGRGLVVEALSVEAIGGGQKLADLGSVEERTTLVEPSAMVSLWSGSRWVEAPLIGRESLSPGQSIEGPAIITESTGTVVVEEGWRAQVNERNHMILTRYREKVRTKAIGTDVDPVMLEVFNNLFMSIAEQMGATLANTSYSVNIKERLDFSCAVFDGQGQLVANAPHVPVHLGSMGESVKAILRQNH
ncbi:unnamed protein product, partial [Cyprideis torosa]